MKEAWSCCTRHTMQYAIQVTACEGGARSADSPTRSRHWLAVIQAMFPSPSPSPRHPGSHKFLRRCQDEEGEILTFDLKA